MQSTAPEQIAFPDDAALASVAEIEAALAV
jgi:hypothetical protein